jgi:hypothetical protein
VAELLDLRGQRAATRAVGIGARDGERLRERRASESVPLDRRIALRVAHVEHLAVLDEEQRVDHDLRDVLELRVDVPRVARGEEVRAVRAHDRQAGAVLLAVDGVEAEVLERLQPRRMARLRTDLEARGGEPRDEIREPRVAEPVVVGSGAREANRRAGAGLHGVLRLARDPGQVPGLELGRAQLVQDELHRPGDGQDQGHDQDPTEADSEAAGLARAFAPHVRQCRVGLRPWNRE